MLSVIVPTYNERENIPELIDRTLSAFDKLAEPAELLFVDDNSPDGTAELIRSCATQRNETQRVRMLVRTEDRGLAKAVVAGFAAARGDVVAVMDADLSHPPEKLPDLLHAVRSGAEIAVASRHVAGGGTEGWPWRRRLISFIARWLAIGLTPVRDSTSGYFALRRSALAGIDVSPRGYKIGLELFARLHTARATEVPFTFHDRRYGSSKLGGTVVAAYLVQLGTLYRARFPLLLGYVQFGLVGVAGMVIDAIVFGVALYLLGLLDQGMRNASFLAQTMSFLAAAGFNFVLNGLWTFRERAQGAKFRVFLAVSAFGFVLRSLVFVFVLSLPLPEHEPGPWLGREWLALVSGILAASVWNYFGSLRWAYRGTALPAHELPAPEQFRSTSRAVEVYGVIALLVLVFAWQTPLAFDEAYYWQWSRHLAWGYYDHPPMVAFLIAAGTRLLGVSEMGVRLVPLLLGLCIPWLIRDLARRYWTNPHAPAWALAAGISIPLLSVGMTVVTPDIPFVFFWALALTLTLAALERGRLFDWLLVGAAVGLGVLSKYSMLLFAPSVLAALLCSPRGRAALQRPGPYAAALLALAVATPTLLWQVSQGGDGIVYQLQHGLGQAAGGTSDAPGLSGLGRFFAAQLGVVSPILFVLLLIGLGRTAIQLARGTPTAEVKAAPGAGKLGAREISPFLVFLTLIPLAVFAGASLIAKSNANWTAPAYVTGIVLLAGELARWASAQSPRWRRRLAWGGTMLAVLISLYVHIEAVVPMAPYKEGVLTQTWGHGQLATWVQELRDRQPPGEEKLVIAASDYKLASILAFYLPDHPETCDPFETGSGSAYHAWHRRPSGQDRGLFLARKPERSLGRLFIDATPLGEHTILRRGQPIQRTWAYVGRLRPGICTGQTGDS